jgi:hypothetical protein
VVPDRGRGGLAQGDQRRRGAKGKLKEAAETWAYVHLGRAAPGPATIDDDVRRQAAALGAVLPPPTAQETDEGFAVWPENWSSVLTFLELATQWRVAAAGLAGAILYFGLDYAGVRALLQGRADADEIFSDLRVMEAAALPVLNAGDGA